MIVHDQYGIIVQHDPDDPTYLDGGDSASRTGIMALCGSVLDVDRMMYFFSSRGLVRHPFQKEWNDPAKTSRDQLVCFVAGAPQWLALFLRRDYTFRINKDLFNFSVQYHLSNCADHWTKHLWRIPGDVQLVIDTFWHRLNPDKEINQILCILLRHPNKALLRFFCKHNPGWKENLRAYWGGWRDQAEIGEALIGKVESYTSCSATATSGSLSA